MLAKTSSAMVVVPLVMGFNRGRLNGGGRLPGLLGRLALGTAFVVSSYFFWYAFTSVWCFFAALLAALLCFVFARLPDARLAQGGYRSSGEYGTPGGAEGA